ncbi:MAG: VanW family protein [Candidatus Komeilibacteria bacterium]|nr:VanW family protein [Candidatus Komeilibacteria bacterium]
MKWLLMAVTIFLILLTLALLASWLYAQAYSQKFFPGVTVNGESLKNLTAQQAVTYWQTKIDEFNRQGLNYDFQGQKITIYPTLAEVGPDAAYQLIDFDADKTVAEAMAVGHGPNYLANFAGQLRALIFGKNLTIVYQLDQENFLQILKNNFGDFASPKNDARPLIDDELNITIVAETSGANFDYQNILNQSLNNISRLTSETIILTLQDEKPELKQSDITQANLAELKNKLASSSLALFYNDKTWIVPRTEFKNWLTFKLVDRKLTLALDASSTLAFLNREIAPQIYQPVHEAKFAITNGRVAEFQGSQDGQELDLAKSLAKIEHDFLQENSAKIELTVNETKSTISTNSQNDLGIAQIIGTGHSNFKGSPKNRRHNIATGAAALNGLLIKPGETFSLITALGDIDAASGYLPELVIKGDRTIPEYGGGLCQIGTTVFRAALGSGLPIVERRNHSYRVMYYEPAGKDATIYDPKPDFRFLNDTGKHILIQARISGDDIYFDFWGTADGRVAEQTDSVIYNIRPAGPTIIVETTDLKPGEKKCTESAHAGADAYFDYKVTYPDGTVKEERFTSHYIPWQARCLVGVLPTAEPTPTSTPVIMQ